MPANLGLIPARPWEPAEASRLAPVTGAPPPSPAVPPPPAPAVPVPAPAAPAPPAGSFAEYVQGLGLSDDTDYDPMTDVNARIAPQITQLDRAQRDLDFYSTRQTNAVNTFGAQLAGVLGGIGGPGLSEWAVAQQQQDLRATGYQQFLERQKIVDARIDLQGQIPSMIAEAMSDHEKLQTGRIENALALRKAWLEEQGLAFDQDYKVQQLELQQRAALQAARDRAAARLEARRAIALQLGDKQAARKLQAQIAALQSKTQLASAGISAGTTRRGQDLTYKAALARARRSGNGKPPAASQWLSREAGVLVDGRGNAITDQNGNPIPIKHRAPGSRRAFTNNQQAYESMTAAQQNKMKAFAAESAAEAWRGVRDKDDTRWISSPRMGYQKALRTLMRDHGVPLSVAQAALNAYYKPGVRGRPKRSFQERNAGGPRD